MYRYPGDNELEKIENWEGSFNELVEYVREWWNWADLWLRFYNEKNKTKKYERKK